jgi:predicted component of type VI protein secretion system
MPAQLISLDNSASILLDKPILLVGRHPECDIQIESRKISRRHCCIAQVADYLVIRDLGSTNGIRINGTRLNEGKLVAGDEVTIGNNRYQVTWESVAPPKPALPAAVPLAGAVKLPDKAPAKAQRIKDELLEECDEPVALEEEEESPARQTPPSPVPAPPMGGDAGDAGDAGHELCILPDSFELAQRSGIAPPGEAAPS